MPFKLFARCWISTLGAVVLVAVCVGSASAFTGLRFSPGGAGTLSGTLHAGVFEGTLECPITLSGSFATTLVTAAERETVIGSLTEMRSGVCARGSVRSVTGLPSALTLSNASEAPAGAVEALLLRSRAQVSLVLSNGQGCVGTLPYYWVGLEGLGNNEYRLSEHIIFGNCNTGTSEYFVELIIYRGLSTSQTVTFLPGNEVIDGFTPSPVVFGTVRPGELVQRTVTIGSRGGGRIEEIVVTSQRYFAITDPNECRGRTLAARGMCNINVILSAPTEAGRTVTDTLTVTIAGRRFEGALRAST